jgi:hypothetical protein
MDVFIGDTPEARAARDERQTKLMRLVTVGCNLVRQRNSFRGKLDKRELMLRHQLDGSARRYRDFAIAMLVQHPEVRGIVNNPDFANLRDAFPGGFTHRVTDNL